MVLKTPQAAKNDDVFTEAGYKITLYHRYRHMEIPG
jgi:hypothetical protein